MDTHLDPIIARQHAAFTRRQARSAGFHRATVARRVGRGTWIEVNHQVLRLAAAPQTDRQEVMCVVLSGGPDTVATASTTLALPPPWPSATASRGGDGAASASVGIARSRRDLPTRRGAPHGGRRHPDRHGRWALFDFAADVRRPRLARAVDAALAAKKVTVPELQAVITDLAEHGRHGSSSLRAVVAERLGSYVAPATGLESAFLELVLARDLPEPERQVDLGGLLHWIGRVDFLWRAQRVVVETDGAPYHDSLIDRADDERRDRALEDAGWIVLRFSDLDVATRPTSVIRTVSRALAVAA